MRLRPTNEAKACTKCGGAGPFYKRSDTRDGLSSWCRACTKGGSVSHRKAHPDETRQWGVQWRAAHPKRLMVQRARRRALDSGIPFDITEDDFEIPDVCPVLGTVLVSGVGSQKSDNSPSLDRVDNLMGYVRGNVRVISWRANRLKSDASAAELRQIADYIDGQRSRQ